MLKRAGAWLQPCATIPTGSAGKRIQNQKISEKTLPLQFKTALALFQRPSLLGTTKMLNRWIIGRVAGRADLDSGHKPELCASTVRCRQSRLGIADTRQSHAPAHGFRKDFFDPLRKQPLASDLLAEHLLHIHWLEVDAHDHPFRIDQKGSRYCFDIILQCLRTIEVSGLHSVVFPQ